MDVLDSQDQLDQKATLDRPEALVTQARQESRENADPQDPVDQLECQETQDSQV